MLGVNILVYFALPSLYGALRERGLTYGKHYSRTQDYFEKNFSARFHFILGDLALRNIRTES